MEDGEEEVPGIVCGRKIGEVMLSTPSKTYFLRRRGDTEGVLFLTHFVVTQVCLLL